MNTKELRKFGFSFGLGLNILGCIMFFRHREHFIWFTAIGSTVFILAILYPVALSGLKRLLDSLIRIIGWITAVISLLTAFYLVFTPIALLLKVFKRDLLNQKIEKAADTYWVKRKNTAFSKESYERMG